jgi:tetratricopeptide (TPR) repeat protein
MKKIIFVIAMFSASAMVFAQADKVKLSKKLASSGEPDFAQAELLIDEACQDPFTKNLADTWYVKGLVFAKQWVFEDDKRYLVPPEKPDVNRQTRAAYLAYQAWKKADVLDQEEAKNNPKRKGKLKYRKDILKDLGKMKNYISAYGEVMINNKEYSKAIDVYEEVLAIPSNPLFAEDEKFASTDSMFYFAKENHHLSLQLLYQEQMAAKDTIAAEKTLLKGRKMYEQDPYFLQMNIMHDLWANRGEQAMANLNEAIAKNPQPAYYLVRGQIYLIQENFEAARADMNAAIEKQPDFYEAIVMLADIDKAEADKYFNFFMDWEMKKPSEAKTAKAKSDQLYNNAISIYEKARLMKNNTDDNVLRNLQQLYRKMKQYDKEKEIRALRGF